MLDTLTYIWKTRLVWSYAAWLKSKVQFARTTFGSFWIGLSNLLTVGVLGLVYSTIFKVADPRGYFIYIAIGLTIWNFLSTTITGSVLIYEQNRFRLLNTSLQPLFFNLEAWAFNLFSFLQAFSLVAVVTFVMQPAGLVGFLCYGWLPLLNVGIGSFTLAVITSLLGARFRDVYQVVPIALQLAFLSAPILYPEKYLTRYTWLADWNPPYRLVRPLRSAIVEGQGDFGNQIGMLALNLALAALVLWLYRRWRPRLPFWL